MKKITTDVEYIALKRLGKKLWQFGECDPKRVELAVLDYLKSKGWQGYFTEHFDYDKTILIMMCWCNSIQYFKEKRRLLRYHNPNDIFNFASDGYWDLDRHKFSHREIINNAENFSCEMIPEILKIWKERGVKGLAVGSPYHRRTSASRPATDLNADTLVSFYKARGGLQYYMSYLNCFHNAEFQKLRNRRRILDQKIYASSENTFLLRDTLRVSATYLQAISPLGWTPENASIAHWIKNIDEMEGSEFKNEMLSLALDIEDYWKKNHQSQLKWDVKAFLDLLVWKESVVSVEVKAPQDYLKPHQSEQLQLDAQNGVKSWVIEVSEGEDSFFD